MANTNISYGKGTLGQSAGGVGPYNSASNRGDMQYYGAQEPNDHNLVGMIENVAASLDKRQILSALTGVARGAPGQSNNVSKRPRLNALKSRVELQLEVPNVMVGHFLGKGGQNIKDMVRRSKGARFSFQTTANNSTTSNDEMRTLTITGTFDQAESAYHLVHDSVEEFSRPTFSSNQY